jgi:hypothetical protein
LDAPDVLKQEIYRVAALINGRVEISGMTSLRRNPDRDASPPSVLLEFLFKLFEEQQGRCALCGGSIALRAQNKLLQMSADRLDSSNPSYRAETIVIAHLACNLAKSDATLEEFEQWLEVATVRGQRGEDAGSTETNSPES